MMQQRGIWNLARRSNIKYERNAVSVYFTGEKSLAERTNAPDVSDGSFHETEQKKQEMSKQNPFRSSDGALVYSHAYDRRPC